MHAGNTQESVLMRVLSLPAFVSAPLATTRLRALNSPASTSYDLDSPLLPSFVSLEPQEPWGSAPEDDVAPAPPSVEALMQALGPLGMQRGDYSTVRVADWQHLQDVCEDTPRSSRALDPDTSTMGPSACYARASSPAIQSETDSDLDHEPPTCYLNADLLRTAVAAMLPPTAQPPFNVRHAVRLSDESDVKNDALCAAALASAVQTQVDLSLSMGLQAFDARAHALLLGAHSLCSVTRRDADMHAYADTVTRERLASVLKAAAELALKPTVSLPSTNTAGLIAAHHHHHGSSLDDRDSFSSRQSVWLASEQARRSVLPLAPTAAPPVAEEPVPAATAPLRRRLGVLRARTDTMDSFSSLLLEDADVAVSCANAADLMMRIGWNWDFINVLKVDEVRSFAAW